MNRESTRRPNRKLISGTINREGEHIELRYGEILVALVAPGPAEDFTVEFTFVPRRSDKEGMSILKSVRWELKFYLVDKQEPNPWAYAIYHSGSTANLYSEVHWVYCPQRSRPEALSSSSTGRASKTTSSGARRIRQTRLVRGKVDWAGEHIELDYFSIDMQPGWFTPLARVAPGPGNNFTVQYSSRLIADNADPETRGLLKETEKELKRYLVGNGEYDAWQSAIQRCDTTSRSRSKIRWVYSPKKSYAVH